MSSGIERHHPNFSGLDLRGHSLCEIDVSKCNFEDCVFDADTGGDCEFDLNFFSSQMSRVKMQGLYLFSTCFVEANLQEANFDGCFFQGVDFQFADLSSATLTNTDWCSDIDQFGDQWSITLGDNAKFVNAKLSGSKMNRVELTSADFTGADLSQTHLQYADLTGSVLAGANLVGADLTGAVLKRANLSNADLSNATLTDCDLEEAILEGATMPDGSIHP